MKTHSSATLAALAVSALAAGTAVQASSHREAPLITSTPKLDCADYYLFNSYESGRSNFVTVVANYLPLQDAYGGPNYFTLDPNGVYELHFDTNGDAREDLTFQFQFQVNRRGIALPIGPAGNQRTNEIPLIVAGPIGAGNNALLNVDETYRVKLIRGDRRTGTMSDIVDASSGALVFTKPVDNIGNKSLPDYDAYANQYVYDIKIPGCEIQGRMFVGQRKDPFVVNLGETFDLVNLNPLGPVAGAKDSLADKNVTSIILELPKDCLAAGGEPVIGGWTTASRRDGTNLVQVSRLSMPLVNEVVIGLKDKDTFNASEPRNDGQFFDYVTHPTLPVLLQVLFGVQAPNVYPRADLVAIFATGVPGLNQPAGVVAAEMTRLNTALPATTRATQSPLGVLGGDLNGYPNGRRPGDDVVDISLRAVMGVLLSTNDAPHGQLPYTDGAYVDARMFPDRFPYLNPPIAGSPNDPTICITLQSADRVDGRFVNRAARFNPARQELVVPRAADAAEFYRLKADRPGVQLGAPVVDESEVKMKVQLP